MGILERFVRRMRCAIVLVALMMVALIAANKRNISSIDEKEQGKKVQMGYCSADIRGASYDLTDASHANDTSTDWKYQSNDGNTYYVNVCNNLVSNNPCGNDAPGYAYNPTAGTCQRLGLLEAEWWGNSYYDTVGDGDGIVVMYNEGDSCTQFSRAKMSLLFHCNTTVSTTTLTSIVAIGQYCHWVAHFESPLGCSL